MLVTRMSKKTSKFCLYMCDPKDYKLDPDESLLLTK